jgi:hypothetical protein
VEKKGKKNVYNGRMLEIQGLPNLTVEQAFELSDASAERSAGGCTIELSEESVAEYLRSNITMLRWMIDNGYEDARTLERRAKAMEAWLENPTADASRRRRRVRRGHRDQHVRDHRAAAGVPERPGRRQAAVRGGRRQGSTRSSSVPA